VLSQFKQNLLNNRHRALVVIAGQWDWCLAQLDDLSNQHNTFWLGDLPENRPTTTALTPQQTLQRLGQECDQLVINGFSGIDLNALGAISGTLTAGGLCYLLCPELAKWPLLPDPQNQRFCVYPYDAASMPNRLVQHLVNTIIADKHCLLIEQDTDTTPPPSTIIATQPKTPQPINPPYKTEQQQLAVEKIKKVATGHRRRPLVLTADRGRGKSSALGLALSELLKAGKRNIIISAPHVASVAAVFERAVEQLNVIKQSATELITTEGSITFIAPDELIRQQPQADLVMIDEAAAIPAPMLTQLLKQYSRLVFTSTIAGYEGTGRGFEIRFKQTLNQLTPDWQAYHMTQPIRWAEHDPLEQFIHQALMLNAQAAEVMTKVVTSDFTPEQVTLTWQNRNTLLDNSKTLSQIIGLLTLAHYKTTPNDFRHLLDGSNIQLYTQTLNGDVVGTALVAIEGNFPDVLCEAIYHGERRPKGHLLPQTLSTHAGFIKAGQFRYARVMRIAIHPELQNQGLGSQLLQQLAAAFTQQSIDFIGAGFGVTGPLLSFWQNNGMHIVRLGLNVEATSNEYSSIVLQPLNAPATNLLNDMQHKFDDQLPHLLTEFYPLLPAGLVLQLLQQQTVKRLAPLDAQDLLDIDSYIHHRREYEFCSLALYKLALLAIAEQRTQRLDEQQVALLVAKVFRRQSWQEVCRDCGFVGKKVAAGALKRVFRLLSVI
jgi:tRNA(Met) cytidine acetyltransferase